MPLHGNGWNPNTINRAVQGLMTATRTVRIETELGEGFLKALGNPEGPHSLACELVGSLAADWLGLRTLDFSLIEVTDPEEVAFEGQSWAQPGPAFISRAEDTSLTWGGDPQTLSGVSNTEDISRLVVLDTWIRNCDDTPQMAEESISRMSFLYKGPNRYGHWNWLQWISHTRSRVGER